MKAPGISHLKIKLFSLSFASVLDFINVYLDVYNVVVGNENIFKKS